MRLELEQHRRADLRRGNQPWLSSMLGSSAARFDPATGVAVGTYSGLSSPYTYSDMTGWALQNAACTPEG